MTFVLAKLRQNRPVCPFHDDFNDCFWTPIAEDVAPTGRGATSRFRLSAVTPTHFAMADGRQGPLLTRLDEAGGTMWVAIPETLRDPRRDIVDLVWRKVG